MKGHKGFFRDSDSPREQDTVPVWLTPEERQWLEALKISQNLNKDSTVLKAAAFKEFLLAKALKQVENKRYL